MTRNGEAVWSLISILLGTLSLVLANFRIGDHWTLLGLGVFFSVGGAINFYRLLDTPAEGPNKRH